MRGSVLPMIGNDRDLLVAREPGSRTTPAFYGIAEGAYMIDVMLRQIIVGKKREGKSG